ncbi:MAG: hypothetical protein IKI71_03110 [Lachnospiraceae bacterium]|nr:hypothetical protein [Lachnospiraceae bacterium]
MNKENLIKTIKVILLSLVVVLIAVFFMSKKANLDIDEAYTYGLANNTFQMNIENFKEYGGEELLIDYAAVKEDNKFDIANVCFNQKNDTHPPLYFLLVNFISSLNELKFSMWYGLYINILFLIIIFWGMAHLLNKIINNKLFSIILTYISFILYGFINFYSFTRMYVMLSAVSILFVILVVDFIDSNTKYKESLSLYNNIKTSEIDFKFLIKFYIICVIGILTQYHFMIIAGFFSLVLAVHLIKNKKFKLLFATFVVGVLSILTAILIFPPMLDHIFNTSTSLHAITSFANPESLSNRLPKLLLGLNKAFFGIGLFIYIALFVIGVVMLKLTKKIYFKNVFTFIKNHYIYFTFLLAAIFYFVIVCVTVKFSFQRYLYNIYPLIYIVIISPIYLMFFKLNKYFIFMAIVLALLLGLTTNYGISPTSLNIEDSIFENYLHTNRDTKMILLYRTVDKELKRNSGNTSLWKMPSSIYIFKDMKNMTFVDISNDAALTSFSNDTIEGYNDIFLVIYTFENDDYLIRNVMAKNNVSRCEKVYFTTYYHMYHLY